MNFPSILKFKGVSDFFQSFYEMNHPSADFTYRHFAEQIDWPHSYLNDLMKGRKPLTLKRALEFSSFAKMSAPETERLISLGLLESCPEEHKGFFKRHLANCLDFNLRIDPTTVADEVDRRTRVVDANIFKDPILIALLVSIKWLKENADEKSLARFLFSFPELQDPQVIQEKLNILEQQNCIQKKDGRFIVAEGDIYFCPEKTSDMSMAVENLMKIINSAEHRGSAWSGFALIRKSRLLEMHQRASALANWIFNEDSECGALNIPAEECFPMKYDVFMSHAIDLTQLGYSLESDVIIQEQVPVKTRLDFEL